MTRFAISATLLLVLSSCSQKEPVPSTLGTVTPDKSEITSLETYGADRYYSQINDRFPGFAGMYFRRDGTPVIRSTQQSGHDALIEHLKPVLKERYERWHKRVKRDSLTTFSKSDVVVESSQYDFNQLVRWRNAISRRTFGKTGVNMLDLSETENKIVIGVERPQDLNPNAQKIRQLGIPESAYRMKVVSVVTEEATLSDRIVPEVAGIAIYGGSTGETCTIGFNSIWQGQVGFWTSDHCTFTTGLVEGDRFYQPRLGSAEIGKETDDALPTLCPSYITNTYKCRYTDSAFIAYHDQSKPLLPSIARPETFAQEGTPQPVPIDPVEPTLTVAGTQRFAVEGEFVEKVGQKTGWTGGFVVNNCVTFAGKSTAGSYRADAIVNRLCQESADYVSAGGDSGSGVFLFNPDGTVTLVGIHVGRTFVDNLAIFSDFLGFESDYGLIPQVQ